MLPTRYDLMSDMGLLALCAYREARGETTIGKRAVCWVVLNRVAKPGWWGNSVHSVILRPYQFSSFLPSDPNSNVWPADEDADWEDCLEEAQNALEGKSTDPTGGATLYFSPPLVAPPQEWGQVIATAHIGHLELYKAAPPQAINVDASDA
jgi:N-acetylmuramoyl-L-alanine amidase